MDPLPPETNETPTNPVPSNNKINIPVDIATQIAENVISAIDKAVGADSPKTFWQMIDKQRLVHTIILVATLFGFITYATPVIDNIATVASYVKAPVKADNEPSADTLLIIKSIDSVNSSITNLATIQNATRADIKKLSEDIKPVDPPTPPVPPTPTTKLALPEMIVIDVSSSFTKITADSKMVVNWFSKPNDDLTTQIVGNNMYVSAKKAGTYVVFAYITSSGSVTDAAACLIVAGQAPPTPKPPTPPTPPTPIDFPTSVPGMRVLIVVEEMKPNLLTGEQRAIVGSAPMHNWFDSICAVGADNKTKEWRIYDKDQVVTAETKQWQDMMARKRDSVPWIVINNYPKGYFEGPLPATIAETKALISKYAN